MVAKLTDVAKLAGVSPTTVSRVINNKGYLSEKTINKVRAAMKELGYKPNILARGLQGKSPKLIGLIFPSISNIFYAELIEHLENELFKRGYKTIICNSEDNSTKEKEYIEMLEANQVDGIISSSHNLGISDYERVDAPIVAFDRYLAPNIPIVASDNREGGRIAANMLIKSGAKDPIMITGNDNSDSPTSLRREGFSEILPHADIINIPSDYSPIRKSLELQKVLTGRKPDSIFVSDDMTAIMLCKVAKDLGLEIGKDLKVIGYDGTFFIEMYYPMLTTIKQPIHEIARLTVEILVQKINNPEQEPNQNEYILPVSLIPGSSI